MTELLFYANAYLKNCEARVITADERGIVLDRTVFYPLGGGRPGDVGSPPLPDPLPLTSRRPSPQVKGGKVKMRRGGDKCKRAMP